MDRLTYRDDEGRARLTKYGMRMYCSTQATADCFAKLEESVPRWISVKERLPEEDVVVILTDHIDVGTGWFNGKGWRTPFSDIDEYRITHWMPLPEPPREVEDG